MMAIVSQLWNATSMLVFMQFNITLGIKQVSHEHKMPQISILQKNHEIKTLQTKDGLHYSFYA